MGSRARSNQMIVGSPSSRLVSRCPRPLSKALCSAGTTTSQPGQWWRERNATFSEDLPARERLPLPDLLLQEECKQNVVHKRATVHDRLCCNNLIHRPIALYLRLGNEADAVSPSSPTVHRGGSTCSQESH